MRKKSWRISGTTAKANPEGTRLMIILEAAAVVSIVTAVCTVLCGIYCRGRAAGRAQAEHDAGIRAIEAERRATEERLARLEAERAAAARTTRRHT